MFIGDVFHVFRKKNPNGNAENEDSMTCYTPVAMYNDIGSSTISLYVYFSLFHFHKVFAVIFRCLPGSSFCRI
jgi:hypothetical protein